MSALHELAQWAAREGHLDPSQVDQLATLGLLDVEPTDASMETQHRAPDEDEALEHERIEGDLERRRAPRRGGRRGHRSPSRSRGRLRRVDDKVKAVLAEAGAELDRLCRLVPSVGAHRWEDVVDELASTAADTMVSRIEDALRHRRLGAADIVAWLGIDPLGSVLPSVELEPEDLPTFRRVIGLAEAPLLRADLPGLGIVVRLERAQLTLVRAVRQLVEDRSALWDRAMETSFDAPTWWLVCLLWSLEGAHTGPPPEPWLGSALGPEAAAAWRWAAELDDHRTAVLLLEEHMKVVVMPWWLRAVDGLTTRAQAGGRDGGRRRGLALPPHLVA